MPSGETPPLLGTLYIRMYLQGITMETFNSNPKTQQQVLENEQIVCRLRVLRAQMRNVIDRSVCCDILKRFESVERVKRKREVFHLTPLESQMLKGDRKKISSIVPVSLSSMVKPEARRSRNFHDLILRYGYFWMNVIARENRGAPEYECYVALKTWDMHESYRDPAEWIEIGKRMVLMAPFVHVHREDALVMMKHCYVVSGEYVAGSHYFNDLPGNTYGQRLSEFGYDGAYSRYSGFVGRQELNSARWHERRQLREFCKENIAMKTELEAMRARDGNKTCVRCGQLKECCDYCRSCCPRTFKEHRALKATAQGLFSVDHRITLGNGEIDTFIKGLVGSLGGRLDKVGERALIGLPLCLTAMWRHRTVIDWTVAVTSYVNALGLSTTLASSILNKILWMFGKFQELFSGGAEEVDLNPFHEEESMWRKFQERVRNKFKPKAQFAGAESLTGVLGALGGLACIVLAIVGTRSLPSDKEVTNAMLRFAAVGRCITSCEKIHEYGVALTEQIMRLVRIHIFHQNPSLIVENYDTSEWCRQVAELIDTNIESKVKYNMELKTKVDALLVEGDTLLKKMDKLKIAPASRVRFNKLYDHLHRLRALVATSGAGCAELRPNPVVVHLYGNTGAGKSSILWPAFMDLLPRMGVETYTQAKEAVYFRYAGDGNKNWDGYHNATKIVSIDDIFTKKDSESNPNQEVDEAIRMNNNAYWPLPMAHLNDKGVTHFGASLVTWSSNRAHFVFPSRTNAEAIRSRVTLKFRVEPKPEYAETVTVGDVLVKRLDKTKIGAALVENPDSITDFVDFVQMNALSSSDEELARLSYEEFVELVWTEIKNNETRFVQMSKGLERRFEQQRRKVTAQGLFYNTVQNSVSPGGVCLPLLRSWTDTFKGYYHYNPFHLLKEHVRSVKGVYEIPYTRAIDLVEDPVPVDACVCVKGALTLLEQEQIVAMMLREERCDWSEKAAQLTFGNRLVKCTDHTWTPSPSVLKKIELFRAFVAGQEEREVLNSTYERYLRDEEDLTQIGVLVLSIVAGLLAAAIATGIAAGVEALIPASSSNRVRKGAVGRPAKPQSRQEKDDGRVSVKVESRQEVEPGHKASRVERVRLEHESECWENLMAVAESLDSVWSGVDKSSYAAIRESLEPRADLRFDCKCNGGRIQAVLDQNAAEITGVAFQNLYRLDEWANGRWNVAMNVLFVRGRMAVCNKHLLLKLKDPNTKWRIVNTTRPVGYEFTTKELRYLSSSRAVDSHKDVAMLEFPVRVHQHRDIVQKFATAEDQGRVSEFHSICITGHLLEGGLPIVRQYFADHAVVDDSDLELWDEKDRTIGRVRNFLKYKIQTSPGDCGGVIVAFDKRLSNKIIGIHAGGFESGGYSGMGQPVTRDMLEFLLGSFKPRHLSSQVAISPPVDVEIEPLVVADMLIPPEDMECAQVYGRVNSGVYQVGKTQIMRSPLYGEVTVPTTAPAKLRPFRVGEEMVDPMKLAQEKVRPRPTVFVDPDLMRRCVDDVTAMCLQNVRDEDRRVVTFKEAISGVDGDDAYPSINRKSSPGYGWPPGGGKRKYLGVEEYRYDHPEVLRRYDEAMKKLQQGERINAVFQDTLKDERRDLKRVAMGKTRLFSAGEMIFTIIFRRYFMGWSAHMFRNKIDFESCVGVNPLGSDWHRLASGMLSVGNNFIAGDFSNYDASLVPELLWGVFNVVDQFYAGEDQKIRMLLWSEVVNSWHVVGDKIHLWSQSNPSGCPITSLLNSVAHSIAARYAYLIGAANYCPKQCDLLSFRQNVVHRSFGDDDLWSVSEAAKWLTQDVLTEGFASLGMTYTDEAKSTESRGHRRLTEVTFLKRAFRWDDEISRWVGPLSLNVVLEMAMWLHSSSDVYLQTGETLETAVMELAIHSKDVYDLWMPVFQRCQRKLERYVQVRLPSRTEVLLQMRNKEFELKELSWGSNPLEPNDSTKTEQACVISRVKSMPSIKKARIQGAFMEQQEQTTKPTEQEPEVEEVRRQIVTFTEEGDVSVSDPGEVKPEYSFLEGADDKLRHTVNDFLQRPIEYTNFTWTTAQAAGTAIVQEILLPQDWLKYRVINEKLAGFAYLRCGFKVRVQVNAQPFHAGRLLVMFDPLYAQQRYNPSNLLHFGGITGYQHIDIDLSQSTAGEIVIPYLSNMSHFDLPKAIGNLGAVRIYVYSQLRGPTDVEGTIWVEATNVDTQMATGLTPYPRLASAEFTRPSHAYVQAGHAVDVRQGPKITKKMEEAEKAVIAKRGPIEELARVVSSGASALSAIPAIEMPARAISWVADAVAGTASIFGWSKPLDSTVVTKIVPSYGSTMANYSGDSKAKVLALAVDNEVKIPTEVFGTTQDEMSIKYITSRPTYLSRFLFRTTSVTNDVLWMMPVTPAACPKYTQGTRILKGNTNLSYLAELFNTWRGSLRYDFKIIKTVYHSARIRLIFVPGVFEETDLSLIDVNRSYSKVIDIREQSEFSYTVPFVYHQPWASLRNQQAYSGARTESIPTGMLYIEVINALRAPSVAPDVIEFLVEVSAGDDFQFGYPGIDSSRHLIPFLSVNTMHISDDSETKVRKQLLTVQAPQLTSKQYLEKMMPKMMEVKNIPAVIKTKHVPSKKGEPLKAKPVVVEPARVVSKVEEKINVVPEKVAAVPDVARVDVCELPRGSLPDNPQLTGEQPIAIYTEAQREVLMGAFRMTHDMTKTENMVRFDTQFPGRKQCQVGKLEYPLWTEDNVRFEGFKTPTHTYISCDIDVLWAEAQKELVYAAPEVRDIKRKLLWQKFLRSYPMLPKMARAQSNFIERTEAPSLNANVFGMGEAVVSLRQLLKRYQFIATTQSGSWTYWPYMSGASFADRAGYDASLYNDLWNRLSQIYRWQTGSRRVALTGTKGASMTNAPVRVRSRAGFTGPQVSPPVNSLIAPEETTTFIGEAVVMGFPSEEFLEFSLPFYQRGPAIPTGLGGIVFGDLDNGSVGNDYVPNNRGTKLDVSHTQSLDWWTSIGEDFAFGYLVGVPVTAHEAA